MTMLEYIKEQPEVLDCAIQNRKELTRHFYERFAEERPDHIYMIASGTSCNAARAAAPFVEKLLEIEVTVFPPSRAEKIWGKNPMVLLIAQEGRSTNILKAAENLKEYRCVGLTGDLTGILHKKCGTYVEIPCGEEHVGPKTKGYTATILILYLMALEAGRAEEIISEQMYLEYLDAMQCAVRNLKKNIDSTMEWVEKNKQGLSSMQEAYIIGKKQELFPAQEGSLKLMETMLVPGLAFDFEEYMHEPSCSIREKTSGFYLLPPKEDEDYERMKTLAEYHRTICNEVYIIGDIDDEDIRNCA